MSASNRQAELEQVVRGMRDRLVAVSDEVSQALTRANWHAETAPAHVRLRVQAGIGEITHTQEWLQGRLAQLPEDPQRRYASMQDMLQVQFVAVQKVTSILDELLALKNKPTAPEYLPPELRPPAPQPSLQVPGQVPALSPFGPLEAGAPIARDFGPALANLATVPLFDPPGLGPQFSMGSPQAQPMPPQQALHPAAQMPMLQPQWGAAPQGFSPQHHGPAPLLLANLDPSFAQPMMPPVDMPRAITGRKDLKPGKQKSARKYARPASGKRRWIVTAGLLAAILGVGAGGYYTWMQEAGRAKPQRIAIGDPSARSATGTGMGAAPVRSVDPVVGRVPQAPAMSAPPFSESGDDFVPVIATHRDKDGLTTLFMDLRKQYPNIVATRKATAQTVNLGADGVWYQLILLPPGPRQQAEGICEELRSAGYSRCAVRTNRP